MRKRIFNAVAVVMACLIMIGCSGNGNVQMTEASLVITSVHQTAETGLTQTYVAQPAYTATHTPTKLPSQSTTPTASSTIAQLSSDLGSFAQAPPVASVCDIAGFIADITIPDGTQLEPSVSFIKTWSLRNDGGCTWTSDYLLSFYSGDLMSGLDDQQFISDLVNPGEIVEVSIELISPPAEGHYIGYWALQNASGDTFGIGAYGDPFYVEIHVVDTDGTETITPTSTETPSITETNTSLPIITETETPMATLTVTATETAIPIPTGTSTETEVPSSTPTLTP